MPPTSPSATQTTTVPVAARTDYRRTPPPVPEIDEHTVFVRHQRPQLIVQFDSGETSTTAAPAVLGRNPDAIDGHSPVTISSPSREVSRTHALVDVDDDGRLIVTDHGSSNGTYVDGRELTPHTPTIVAASAQLQLGDTHVRLQSRTGSAAQPSSQG